MEKASMTEQSTSEEFHNLKEFDKLKAVWVKKSRVNELRVGGVISTATAVKLREEGEHWIKRLSKNYSEIHIDMKPTVPRGTVCVSLMLCWQRMANKLGVELEFFNIPLDLRNIIQLSGLKDVFRTVTAKSKVVA